MIRIGLVGCGHIGTVHAVALQQLAAAGLVDAALTRTFDDDSARAGKVAHRHGGQPAPTLEALLDAVDVVWVCTWTAAHLAAVEAAAARGLPVFCEKPLAPDLASAEAVTSALERVPHQVGLVLRWAPVFRNFAARIASGEFGRVLATSMRDDQYYPIQGLYGSTWRRDVACAGGGTLIEHSIHDIDVLRWLLGDPATVSAHTACRFGHPGIEDVAAVRFSYADGSVAQLTSVWHQILSRESSRRLEVFCEKALLWSDDDYLGAEIVVVAPQQRLLAEHLEPATRFPREDLMPDARQLRNGAVRVRESDGGHVLDAGMPEPARSVCAHRRRIAEQPAQHVDVVNRVLDQCAAACTRDVAAPRGSVKPLNRVVLVVSHRRREHSPEFSGRDARREVTEDRRPAQHETNLVRHAFQRARDCFGRREIGRERFLAEDRQPASCCRLDCREMR